MSTTGDTPQGLDPETPPRPYEGELRLDLDPLLHGPGRVPGQPAPAFDVHAFASALEHHEVEDQLLRYATSADVRIVDPDGPARTVRGRLAIRAWLIERARLDVTVTDLVDGGDRIAFTERWSAGGDVVVATSTAELQDDVISTQHTILARVSAVVRRDQVRAANAVETYGPRL